MKETLKRVFTKKSNRNAKSLQKTQRSLAVESLEGRQLLATLISDSFEVGEWNGVWVEDSQNDWFRSSQRASDGSYSAELDGRASDATLTLANAVDLTGYADAQLTFDWYIESSLDSGEYLALDLSDDNGQSWNQFTSLNGNVNQENAWLSETIDLDDQYLNSSEFTFRFRGKMNKSNEDANVDNVQLVATPDSLNLSINDATVDEGSYGFKFVDAFDSGSEGGLTQPRGMTFGPNGNLFVVSNNNDSVLEYNSATGAFVGVFVASGEGGLDIPRDLAFHNGDLFVTSAGTDNVKRFDGTTGAFKEDFITTAAGGLNSPNGIYFGTNNDLYVTDAGEGDAILRYNATNGDFIDAFVPQGDQGIDNPSRILAGPDGNFYVSDILGDRVLRYDSDGDFVDEFISAGAGGLDAPRGMAFYEGFLLVASSNTDSIIAYDSTTGEFKGEVVSRGSGGLNHPISLLFDSSGNLLVSSRLSDEILRFAPALTVSLSFSSNDVITVDYAATGGTATEGADFAPISGTLTFAPGETTKSIFLKVEGDSEVESDETLNVTLSNATGGALISKANSSVTITDDDSRRVVSISDASVKEGDNTPHYRGPFVYGQPGAHFNPLTFGPDGNIYTAVGTGDGYNTIQKFDGTTGDFIETFMANDDPDHKINGVRDIVFHPTNGLVYVASSYTDEVLRYDASTGEFVDVFVEANSGGIDHPDGMMFGPDFNGDGEPELYVTGWLSHSVVRYDGATGAPLGTYIGSESGGLRNPFALAFKNNEVFVTSAGTNQILKYDAVTGDYIGVAASTGLVYPRGITFGPDDLMYVSSGNNDRILRFDTDGQYIDDFVTAGGGGLDNPRSLLFGPDGSLYVTATGNAEILRYGTENEAIFTVSMSTPSDLPVLMEYTISPSGASPATEGVDYSGVTGQLVFQPGQTERTIYVPILDDLSTEGNETFEVTLALPQGNSAGAVTGDDTGVGTIVDNEFTGDSSALYVYDIRFESKRGGKDWRAVVEIRNDSNADGQADASDAVRAGVEVTVLFDGQVFIGTTDSNGVMRTSWLRNLSSGDHYANVVDVTLNAYLWNSFLDQEDDSDGDGLPDAKLTI